MVTAYDASFAQMYAEAGVDAILVGDSLGMVIQGHDSTLPVTLDEMVYHCRAVHRGLQRHGSGGCHLVGDMPFLSYQVSATEAIRNAGRLLQEGGAHAVKLEGGELVAETVRHIVSAGIPVMGHVGLTPQSIHALGGFRMQGKTESQAEQVLKDAHAVADAGAYALVLEGVPEHLAERITQELEVPVIGIGAGPSCDGQVLVGYDLLGLYPGRKPTFVRDYGNFFELGVEAIRNFCTDVRRGMFPLAKERISSVPSKAVQGTKASQEEAETGPLFEERTLQQERAMRGGRAIERSVHAPIAYGPEA